MAINLSKALALAFAFMLLLPSSQTEARKGIAGLFSAGKGMQATNRASRIDNTNTLTQAQLKDCLHIQDKLAESEQEFTTNQPSMDKAQSMITQLDQEIAQLQAYLDKNRNTAFVLQTQVDEYNTKANRFNQLISQYNNKVNEYQKRQNSFNRDVADHNAIVDKFTRDCAEKRYYEDDLQAVLAR